MRIDKITFKNGQAWVVVKEDEFNGKYIGTWHITNIETVELLREDMPEEIFFRGGKNDKS